MAKAKSTVFTDLAGRPDHGASRELVAATAAMLLFKLSTVLERFGPTVRGLLHDMMPQMLADYDANPVVVTTVEWMSTAAPGDRGGDAIHSAPRGGHSQVPSVSPPTSGGGGSVAAPTSPRVDVDCAPLLTRPWFRAQYEACRAQLSASQEARAVATITASKAARRIAQTLDNTGSLLLKNTFFQWRLIACGTRRLVARWLEALIRRGQKALKREAFSAWRAHAVVTVQQRSVAESSSNSSALMDKIQEKHRLITVREKEIAQQRSLVDRLTSTLRQLETFLTAEREENARLRSKGQDLSNRAQFLVKMAAETMATYEKSFRRIAVTSTKVIESAGGVDRRVAGGATTTSPLRSTPSGSATAALGRTKSSAALAPVVDDAAGRFAPAVANVPLLLKEWVNHMLEGFNAAGGSSSASVAANSGGRTASTATASSISTTRVTGIGAELSDGRVFAHILSALGAPPFPAVDTDHERCAAVLAAARLMGVDGGLKEADLRAGNADVNTVFLGAMFLRFCLIDRPPGGGSGSQTGKQASAASAMTAEVDVSNETLIALQSRFDRLQADVARNRRWVQLSFAVANTAMQTAVVAAAAKLSAPPMAGSGDSATGSDGQGAAVPNVVTPELLRDTMPPAMTAAVLQQAAAGTADIVQQQARQDAALRSVADEMSLVVASNTTALHLVQQHYSAFAAVDTLRPCVLDAAAWTRFCTDTKLVPRVIPRPVADQLVSKTFASGVVSSRQFIAAVLRLYFTYFEGIRKMGGPSVVSSSSAGGSGIGGDAASSTAAGGGAAGGDLVEQFRAFVLEHVLGAGAASRVSLEAFVESFHARDLQEVLRVFRDPLRKIFHDISVREASSAVGGGPPVPRLRLAAFVTLSSDLKLLEPPDAARLFLAIRHAFEKIDGAGGDSMVVVSTAAAASPSAPSALLPSDATAASAHNEVFSPPAAVGVGFAAFQGLMLALALSRLGGSPLASPPQCLKAFLTSSLFPEFQHRLKLKW